MKLFLVRHGESTWNVEGRYQGRQDPPLSARGAAQAEALASRLRAEHISAIVSSPLQRALDTANACAAPIGLHVQVDDRLTEISHGAWEGKLRAEVAQAWPEMLGAWQAAPHTVRFPQGESLAEVSKRFKLFLAQVRQYGEPLLAVTHDVVVRLAILAASGKPLSAFNEIHADNAALNEFTFDGDALVGARVNEIGHLGSLRSDTLSQAL